MHGKKLRVLARGTAMVFDLERHEAGTRRFVGRKHDPTLGAFFEDVDHSGAKVTRKQGGWPPSHHPAQPDVVPYRAEYVAAIRDGDLWAADEETAKIAGVTFDKTFGGEYEGVAPEKSAASDGHAADQSDD